MHLSASVFENAVEAIAISDQDGIVEKINPAFTQITGFTETDIIGEDLDVLDAGDINKAAYREMSEELQRSGQWTGEMWNLRKNNESFPVRMSVTAVRNIRNQITHYVSIFYDISVRKAAERALVRMDQVKSEFISSAAHELRTPLSAIMGYAELVRGSRDRLSGEQINEFLDELYDRGEALNQIIDDLLDVGRIESGKPIDLKMDICNLFELLSRVFDFYVVHAADRKFKLLLPGKNDNSEFLIDKHRIQQVLENLMNNSVKYSEPGAEIRLGCIFKNQHWEVFVEDDGIGMTAEEVEKIFDKFYRADSSNTGAPGFGLGMSIAKQIVEIHGGEIHVESKKGRGTRVVFSLPCVLK
jgi:two-component system phosphate regulon sensor histidine kinase PhoR